MLTERQFRTILADEICNCLKTFLCTIPPSTTKPIVVERLTLREASKRYKISESLLYRNPKKWGGQKIAGKWRFLNSELEEIFAGGVDQK